MVLRSRLLVVALITGACMVGVPIPTHAGPRFPETVERTIQVASGLTLHASANGGAVAQPHSRSLPIRANMAAVSFQTDDVTRVERIRVEARFHSFGGWSAWEPLEIDADEGPDERSLEGLNQSDRVFTGPIWVGLADAMAVRIVQSAGAPAAWDVRGHLFNAMGNASKPSLLSRVSKTVSRFLHGSSAEALTVQPSIITRRGWGADESIREKGCCPRYASSVQMAFVHHTAGTTRTPGRSRPRSCAASTGTTSRRGTSATSPTTSSSTGTVRSSRAGSVGWTAR
jgi:hypothetical protein